MNETNSALSNLVAETAKRKAETLSPGSAQQLQRLVQQDPARTSWRVWGAFWSGAAAILAIPEVQTGLQAALGTVVPVSWAPVLPAALGAVWAIVSKVKDKRQVRSAPWEM